MMVFVVISCNSIAKAVYKIKKPTFQTIESQMRFLERHNVTNKDFFYYKDINSFVEASKTDFLSVPDAFFFNQLGEFVPYQKTASDCNANVDNFINDLNKFNDLNSTDSIKINDILKLLKSNSSLKYEESEITVFLTWAVFAGKVNEQKTFEWIQLIENAKTNGVNISYYLINSDLQDEWSLTDSQKKEIEKLFNK